MWSCASSSGNRLHGPPAVPRTNASMPTRARCGAMGAAGKARCGNTRSRCSNATRSISPPLPSNSNNDATSTLNRPTRSSNGANSRYAFRRRSRHASSLSPDSRRVDAIAPHSDNDTRSTSRTTASESSTPVGSANALHEITSGHRADRTGRKCVCVRNGARRGEFYTSPRSHTPTRWIHSSHVDGHPL